MWCKVCSKSINLQITFLLSVTKFQSYMLYYIVLFVLLQLCVKYFFSPFFSGNVFTLLFIRLADNSFALGSLSDTIKRSTIGGETPNTMHHGDHLSLKTWQAVFMSEPSAVSGGQT